MSATVYAYPFVISAIGATGCAAGMLMLHEAILKRRIAWLKIGAVLLMLSSLLLGMAVGSSPGKGVTGFSGILSEGFMQLERQHVGFDGIAAAAFHASTLVLLFSATYMKETTAHMHVQWALYVASLATLVFSTAFVRDLGRYPQKKYVVAGRLFQPPRLVLAILGAVLNLGACVVLLHYPRWNAQGVALLIASYGALGIAPCVYV